MSDFTKEKLIELGRKIDALAVVIEAQTKAIDRMTEQLAKLGVKEQPHGNQRYLPAHKFPTLGLSPAQQSDAYAAGQDADRG